MGKQHLAVGALVVGLLLIALSWIWPLVVPDELYWSQEKQQEYVAAVERAHALHTQSHATGGSSSQSAAHEHSEEYEQAAAELARQQAEMKAAKSRRSAVPSIIFWLGAASAVAGIALNRLAAR